MAGCGGLAMWMVLAVSVSAGSRIAVITALSEELELLRASANIRATNSINRSPIYEAELAGQDVVLLRCGKSMVNAAMNTQALLDTYMIRAIVFSGIAGGCNPNLKIGDIVVPSQWANHYEHLLARQESDGQWNTSGHRTPLFGTNVHFGMMFPRAQTVYFGNQKHYVKWFEVDAAMLALAGRMKASLDLEQVSSEGHSLPGKPRLVLGGNGVSGSVFVEHAAYREWLWRAFGAQAIDMESAAVAQVAYMNEVPFIVFRSLSDLAGSDSSAEVRLAFRQLVADNSARVVMAYLAGMRGKEEGQEKAVSQKTTSYPDSVD
jgi:adenosylhomocysteine nucleosidase